MPAQRCPLFLAPVVDLRCCDACNQPLPGQRRRWCSDLCWQNYFNNHGWTAARHAALRRATVYVRDAKGRDVAVWRPCDNCGRDTLEGAHGSWMYEPIAARRKPLDLAAEVNHVDPRVGKGYEDGCWNHQTNLQVLCHSCHIAETVRQAAERRAVALAATQATRGAIPLWAPT